MGGGQSEFALTPPHALKSLSLSHFIQFVSSNILAILNLILILSPYRANYMFNQCKLIVRLIGHVFKTELILSKIEYKIVLL